MNYQGAHSEWEEKMVAKISGDLPASDQALLDKHVHTCQACAKVLEDYEMLIGCLNEIEVEAQRSLLPPSLYALQQEIVAAGSAQQRNREKRQAFRKAIAPALSAALSLSARIVLTGMIVVTVVIVGSMLIGLIGKGEAIEKVWLWLVVGLVPYSIKRYQAKDEHMLTVKALFWRLSISRQQGKYSWSLSTPLSTRIRR